MANLADQLPRVTMNPKLRPFRFADVDDLIQHANNENIAKYLTDKFPHPYTNENAVQFIQFANQHTPQSIFAITLNDKVVGSIGLHPQHDIMRKNMELGYWLSEDYWNQGILSKLIPAMVEYGFKTFDIERIYARPFGNNPASARVLEKSGFKLEARFEKTVLKKGEMLDELVYAIRSADL